MTQIAKHDRKQEGEGDDGVWSWTYEHKHYVGTPTKKKK